MANKPTGYIIHETDNVVIIATGFGRPSKNLKTGAMVQIVSLVKNQHPYEALMNGEDKAVCFDCPFRPSLKNETRCYVKLGMGISPVWKAWKRGNYPLLPSFDMFNGRAVRFGTYGEPVLIPFQIVCEIANRAKLHTSYTHQWRSPLFQAYKAYFMASCDESDYELANSMGWRAFIVTKGVKRINGSAPCPASKESGKRVNCADCGACSGLNGRGVKNINIAAH